jgi:hypothetical protein
MKKLIFFVMLAAGMTVSAKNPNDTITVRKPKVVTIITGDSLQKVDIRGRESDSTYHYDNTIQLTDSNYVSTMRINSSDFGFSIGGISRDHHTHHVEITSDLAIGWNSALGALQIWIRGFFLHGKYGILSPNITGIHGRAVRISWLLVSVLTGAIIV